MFKKVLVSVAAAVVLTAGANASTISVIAPDKVFVDDQFEIQIVGDFGADGLIAGGVQLLYDAALFNIDNISTVLPVDASLSCGVVDPGSALCPVDPAGQASLVWGQFLTDLIPVNAGPTVMATLLVTAKAKSDALGSDLSLLDFGQFAGGWFGAGFVTIAPPELLPANIIVNNVPLPAAVWMMIGGLGALARFRRSK